MRAHLQTVLAKNLLSALAHAALVGAVVVMAGCSGADSRPPVADLGEGFAGAAGAANDIGAGGATSADPTPSQECEDGFVRECKIRLPSHAGVANCFVGVQLCEQGSWGDCMDPDKVPGNG